MVTVKKQNPSPSNPAFDLLPLFRKEGKLNKNIKKGCTSALTSFFHVRICACGGGGVIIHT